METFKEQKKIAQKKIFSKNLSKKIDSLNFDQERFKETLGLLLGKIKENELTGNLGKIKEEFYFLKKSNFFENEKNIEKNFNNFFQNLEGFL